MNVYFETYGCAANRSHSEVMKGLLLRSGCEIVENQELADVLVVNSCIVKGPTENRIIHRLKEFREEDGERNIILAGCMPQAEYERAREFAPEASFVGPHNCKDIQKAVKSTYEGETVEFLDERREEKLCLPRMRYNELIDICEIAQGCTGNCTYCQVKFSKGSLKSYDPGNIEEEIRQSLNTGCKEIWMTCQDTASYGRDIGSSFPDLMQRILNLSGKFRIRIGMMNVDTLNENLKDTIDIFRDERVYSFLHLPLQSGSDKVLERMGRNYTSDGFVETVETFREEVEDLNLWTDVMVGFPGETEQDFKKTERVLKDVKPENVNVSRFSPRPGTEAKDMEKVRSEVKKTRSKEMSEITETIRRDARKELEGTEREVLITERGEGEMEWKGRDMAYRNVLVETERNIRGSFRDVEIVDVEDTYLKGMLSE
ncbi:MAG: tRNA (N(6)-L-threonylcarbamoyladenosine(37)-C(2))-methylthiotransferase [Candidatus Aenigmatarchaeota archaeon]